MTLKIDTATTKNLS